MRVNSFMMRLMILTSKPCSSAVVGARLLEEGLEVFLDELIQRRLLGAASLVVDGFATDAR